MYTAKMVAAILSESRRRASYSNLSFNLYGTSESFSLIEQELEEGFPTGTQLRAFSVNPRNKLAKAATEQLLLPWHLFLDQINVLHSFDYQIPHATTCRQMVNILDLNYRHKLGTFARGAKLARMLLVPTSARRADRVVTISQSSVREIATAFGIDKKKILVAYPGVGPGNLTEHLARNGGNKTDSLILAVGTLNRHKNYSRLVEAFALLQDSGARLTIVGRDDGGIGAELSRLAVSLGVAERLTITGRIPAERLSNLYQTATVVVFPSLYEGFGIPVLEAMAAGIPVVCSDIPVLREVAGETAAAYFNAEDPAGIASAVTDVTNNPEKRKMMSQEGVKRATRFSWEASARVLLDAYLALSDRS